MLQGPKKAGALRVATLGVGLVGVVVGLVGVEVVGAPGAVSSRRRRRRRCRARSCGRCFGAGQSTVSAHTCIY